MSWKQSAKMVATPYLCICRHTYLHFLQCSLVLLLPFSELNFNFVYKSLKWFKSARTKTRHRAWWHVPADICTSTYIYITWCRYICVRPCGCVCLCCASGWLSDYCGGHATRSHGLKSYGCYRTIYKYVSEQTPITVLHVCVCVGGCEIVDCLNRHFNNQNSTCGGSVHASSSRGFPRYCLHTHTLTYIYICT